MFLENGCGLGSPLGSRDGADEAGWAYIGVPKVFFKKHRSHARSGRTVIPRFEHTLVYAATGGTPRSSKKKKSNLGGIYGAKGFLLQADFQNAIIITRLSVDILTLSEETFGTAL